MFIIEDPKILYLLLLIIPFAAAFYLHMHRKRKRIDAQGQYPDIRRQMPQYSVGKQHLKFFLCILAYALLVFCLSNPQLGTSVKKAERKGVDVMIALDISNSMNSTDIQPSRLMRAKQAVIRILDKMESDRIGLVVFAGDAYLQLPLTTDYGAAKLFISNIQTSDLSRQGTAIGAAIDLCAQNFDPQHENVHNKAIIVISDGENHEDDAVAAAQNAARKGIVVSTVGMGSPQGAPIPEYKNGQVVSYKKDAEGNVVITRINRAMLEEIAQAGKGFYVEANNISSGVETVFSKLAELDKVSFESRNISDYETRYAYFLAVAVLLLLLEIFVFEKKNPLLNRDRLFGDRKKRPATAALPVWAGLLILLFAGTPLSAQTAIPTNQGNRHYQNGNLHEAEISYLKALQHDSTYYKAKYNLANAQYGQQNYERALENYAAVAENPTLSKAEKSSVFHNLGNTFVQQKDYQKAVEAYIRALQQQPGRTDTRYNLAYAQRMLQQQQQQQNQQQNQQDKQDQKQDQQQQQQNQQQQQKNQEQQDKQNRQQQQPPQDKQGQQDNPQMSPKQKAKQQEAERMLRALENQEKNTLEKIKKSKDQGKGSPVEKDW
ncbi:MAG: VWA domain-containing protein [Bacteroidales bacterium]|nr:VWA domain-containing protein [Bacteroidales bacterium]